MQVGLSLVWQCFQYFFRGCLKAANMLLSSEEIFLPQSVLQRSDQSGWHGTNSAILGNVGAEMWEWQKISSLVGLLTALSRMFVMDMIAFIMNGLILWKFCSVNNLKELSRLMKKYWPFISVTLGGAVQKVCLEIKQFSKILWKEKLWR